MISIRTEAGLCPALQSGPREISEIAGKIVSRLGIRKQALEILVTGDCSMQEYNRHFLGLEGPTNILSFPESDNDSSEFLGHLIVNADAVRRESFLYGQDPCDYLKRLLIHGILHLAGFEHGESMDSTARKIAKDIVHD